MRIIFLFLLWCITLLFHSHCFFLKYSIWQWHIWLSISRFLIVSRPIGRMRNLFLKSFSTDKGKGNSYKLQLLSQRSSYVRRSGSVSCDSAGKAPIADASPRIKEYDMRGLRLLIAKFRSRDGNRGVFSFISDSSLTKSPSFHTMFCVILLEMINCVRRAKLEIPVRIGLEMATVRRKIRKPSNFYRATLMTILLCVAQHIA